MHSYPQVYRFSSEPWTCGIVPAGDLSPRLSHPICGAVTEGLRSEEVKKQGEEKTELTGPRRRNLVAGNHSHRMKPGIAVKKNGEGNHLFRDQPATPRPL
eukprot:GHVU01225220.1.p1 GENE.GHVU01225220.1~~GHVU01225220.1.p1  ORF type:complete len:100 (-),score=3.78 GHVU01225220.1:18-317(-)